MKKILSIVIPLLLVNISFGQKIATGEYDSGLKLAYDNKTNKLTGYFESYSGWDERTKAPQFSCIFYIEGIIKNGKAKIKTYYPLDELDETIIGTIEIINNKTVKIKLPEDHGGCWNVQHFADYEPAQFDLEKNIPWIQIRYIVSKKAYFYSEKSTTKKQKAYLIRRDFICIEKIEGDWAYCVYHGNKTTKGWMKLADLNKL
ncbi:MAG: hypothetical protein V4572_10415 [Bacteroidota bacterium]